MTNELEVIDAKKYNVSVANKVIGIKIKVKSAKKKSNGESFKAIKGLMYLEVITDGKSEGKKNRWLDMHFMKQSFKGCPNECEVHTPEDLTTGTLYVKASKIQAPFVYEVKNKMEDGKEVYTDLGEVIQVYPAIWIKENAIVGFVPYTPDQELFDRHEVPTDAVFEEVDDEEDASLVSDTPDTEETDI